MAKITAVRAGPSEADLIADMVADGTPKADAKRIARSLAAEYDRIDLVPDGETAPVDESLFPDKDGQ